MPNSSENPHVPVSMGSRQTRVLEAGPLRFTSAWFEGGQVLDRHTHARPTFAVMLEGGFDLTFVSPSIRRRDRACPAGTLFTEPPGEMHSNAIHPTGARVLVVQPALDSDRMDPVRAMLCDRLNHTRSARIAESARRARREMEDPDDLSQLAIEALGWEMLAEAARLTRDQRGASKPAGWLRLAEDYVHSHFRDAPRIQDVADAAGVHPAHLAAVFRDAHGVPLGTYMRHLRLEWVTDRLQSGDEPIAALALRAGFADQAHLTRAFRKHTGWTPARYRRARRNRN